MFARPCLALLLASPGLATQAVFSIVPPGTQDPNGSRTSELLGVSPDGSEAVGSISDSSLRRIAIRWTPSGGSVQLPPWGAQPAVATEISADLSTVVGRRGTGPTARALLWKGTSAPVDLAPPANDEYLDPFYVSPDGSLVLGVDEHIFFVPYGRRGLAWNDTGPLRSAYPTDLYCFSAAPDGTFFVAARASGSVRLRLDGTTQPIAPPLPAGYGQATSVHTDRTGTVFGGVANFSNQRDDVFLYDEVAQTISFAPALPGSGLIPHRMSALAPSLGVAVVEFVPLAQGPGLWIPSLGTADLATYAQELGADLGSLSGQRLLATDVSDDGSSIVGTSLARRGWMLEFPDGWWDTVGTVFCDPGAPNSTGGPSRTMAFVSDEIAAAALRLETHGLPGGVFGLYAVAPTTGNVVPPGSAGPLCLGGPIGRFDGPGQIQLSSPQGRVRLDVDLAQLPGPNGPRAAQPGETWHFQYWHRDVLGSTVSNFSNAVTVTAH